jgi:hypothetical protein
LSKGNLSDELERIDIELAKLENLRTSTINRMGNQLPDKIGSSNLYPFPEPDGISERPSISSEWPIGVPSTEMP